MKKIMLSAPLIVIGLLSSTSLMASSHAGHHMHDHGSMATSSNEAMGMGIVHTVDAANRVVNLTHEPIPALNWPEMTMDLPATRRVELSSFKAGDKVHFMLKKGRDGRFRITSMSPAAEEGSAMGHHH